MMKSPTARRGARYADIHNSPDADVTVTSPLRKPRPVDQSSWKRGFVHGVIAATAGYLIAQAVWTLLRGAH